MVGSCATPTCEPRQVRKEAAVSRRWRVPQGGLAGAAGRKSARVLRSSTAGARSPLLVLTSSGQGPAPAGREGDEGGRGKALPIAVPEVPPADPRRGPGAGARR